MLICTPAVLPEVMKLSLTEASLPGPWEARANSEVCSKIRRIGEDGVYSLVTVR
jgi:hypothetical protein